MFNRLFKITLHSVFSKKSQRHGATWKHIKLVRNKVTFGHTFSLYKEQRPTETMGFAQGHTTK